LLCVLGRRLAHTEIGVELVGESTVTSHVSRVIIEVPLRD